MNREHVRLQDARDEIHARIVALWLLEKIARGLGAVLLHDGKQRSRASSRRTFGLVLSSTR